jgi:hypothetical protein|uniref:Uncharacterized protein n=1 Tax=viral metagenome TaxID=1070528 RepID=A0A6C0IWP5_9ZZZZ
MSAGFSIAAPTVIWNDKKPQYKSVSFGHEKAENGEILLNYGDNIHTFRVGDFINIHRGGIGSNEWLQQIQEKMEAMNERIIYLEGLVQCMSHDLRNMRDNKNN